MKKLFLFLFILFIACSDYQKNDSISLKPNWIKEAFNEVEKNFKQIKAIAWWHENWEENEELILLRIDSSPESLSTFQQSISNNYFINIPKFFNNKLISPTKGIYFGAFPDFGGSEDKVTKKRIEDFETLAQKSITWAYFSNNWYQNINFPKDAVKTIHQSKHIPFIRMMARTKLEEGVADSNYSMQNIIDGKFDNDLLKWFNQAAQVDYPLLIEFGTEVNGNWFPWNGVYNGGSATTTYGDPYKPDGPERFIDAYRHIINLSKQAGATNITWFFHIDADEEPYEDWNNFENYYPGDNYIDWIGISVYGPLSNKDDYETFTDKLNNVYSRILEMTTKPIAILEMGITEYWTKK